MKLNLYSMQLSFKILINVSYICDYIKNSKQMKNPNGKKANTLIIINIFLINFKVF